MDKSVNLQQKGSIVWGENYALEGKSIRLQELYTILAELEKQRMTIIKTGSSWSLKNGDDTRQITNVSLAALNKTIADTKREIAQYESLVSGTSTGAVRLVAEV